MYNGTNEIMLSPGLRFHRILLLLCWMAGLVFGIAFSYATEAVSSLMCGTIYSPVSIVGLGAVIVLPYLITAVSVYSSQFWMLMVLAFCKAFSFGACCAAIDLAFSSAGWLIRMLLMFSNLALNPLLMFLWLRSLDRNDHHIRRYMVFSAAVSILIGSVDYHIIAPFLASVI